MNLFDLKPEGFSRQTRLEGGLLFFFSGAVFLSSFLLFLIQPLAARTLLPQLGGGAQVWTSCMMFFQAVLLAGYFYAHKLTLQPSGVKQAVVHLGLLSFAVLLLETQPSLTVLAPSPSESPVLWIVQTLGSQIGLPFLLLSATTPLLQSWFSRSGHRRSGDPYFLSVAGNLGGLAGLLAYPIVIEPALTLSAQFSGWAHGVTLFSGVVFFLALWTFARPLKTAKAPMALRSPGTQAGVSWRLKGAWILYAFVPCSLMLGVTAHWTTDVAPAPWIWVMTLALYLVSLAAAFEPRAQGLLTKSRAFFFLFLIPALAVWVFQINRPFGALLLVEGSFLFGACFFFHLKLAVSRPSPVHLTTFYFCLSVGGVLGGLVNGFLAPAWFPSLWEYPLTLFLAGWLGSRTYRPGRLSWKSFDGVSIGVFLTALFLIPLMKSRASDSSGLGYHLLEWLLFMVLALSYQNPLRFGGMLAGLLVLGPGLPGSSALRLHQSRSFYGVHRIEVRPDQEVVVYRHGSTIHGAQSLLPSKRNTPQTYFHPLGPVSTILRYYRSLETRREVGVVGLGTGSLAAYSEPDEQWFFFEIDPEVKRLAEDPRFFTYLRDSRAPVKILLGDGRLSLARAPDRYFGILFFDVFSSDAIPVHILTREALQLYLQKLARPGVLVFHISNRYLNLKPVLSALANELDLQCLYQEGPFLKEMPPHEFIATSCWMVLVPRKQTTRTLITHSAWSLPSVSSDPRYRWTDDYSNLWSVFKKR